MEAETSKNDTNTSNHRTPENIDQYLVNHVGTGVGRHCLGSPGEVKYDKMNTGTGTGTK